MYDVNILLHKIRQIFLNTMQKNLAWKSLRVTEKSEKPNRFY